MKPKPIDEHRTKSPLRRGLSNFAGRLGFAYYDMYYAQTDLDRPRQRVQRAVDVAARLACEKDIVSVAASLPQDQRHWFDRALEEGSLCYLGRHEGQIIGYIFTNYRAILMSGETLSRLPNRFVYVYNAYVFPEFRGRGIYSAFLQEAYRALQAEGVRYIAAFVERKNISAIAAGECFAVRRERAPILYLPGLKPIVLGRGFRMMKEAAKKLDRERGENDLPPDA